MDTLHVTARLAIHPGKLDEFKALAATCMTLVRDRETGALEYSWFLNDAQTECVVRETFKDSDAVLTHFSNLGETMGALMGVADMTLEVLGNPSPVLTEAAAALAPKVYAPFQSL